MSDAATPLPARLARIAKDFADGVMTPSRTGFAAMLAGAAVMSALALWLFSYGTLGGPAGAYVARSANDSDGLATYRALQLRVADDRRPLLVVLGTSILSNAFASEAMLKQAVDKETGRDWEVAILTTALQSPIDQVALVQSVVGEDGARGRPVVLVIGVDTLHTGWSRQQMLDIDRTGRLGLRSDWADAEIAELGGTPRPRSWLYVRENWHFFITNGTQALLRLMVRKSAPRRFDQYAPDQPLPLKERKRDLIVSQIRAADDPQSKGFLPVLEHLMNRLSAHGNIRVALVHETPSPDLVKSAGLQGVLVREQATYARFAKAAGAAFWPLLDTPDITADAYHDDLHIGDEKTQARLRARLAARVAGLISGAKP